MKKLQCWLIENDCYKKFQGVIMEPTGITVHSTDKAGKVLKRFVQPAAGQTVGLSVDGEPATVNRMLEILGKNIYGNSWNRPGVDACAHAFIGQVADGSYEVCETLRPTMPCWGGGFGAKGSYDGRIIQNGERVAGGVLHVNFEMIEDSNGDKAHCKALYELAVEYCVALCLEYPTIQVDNIVSHKEAGEQGYASGHKDPESYWKKCGTDYTMNKFRAEVRIGVEKAQHGKLPFVDVPKKAWYREAVEWAYHNGITAGTDETHFSPNRAITRAEVVQMMYSMSKNEQ